MSYSSLHPAYGYNSLRGKKIKINDNSPDAVEGVLYTANTDHLIMLAKGEIVHVPIADVRSVSLHQGPGSSGRTTGQRSAGAQAYEQQRSQGLAQRTSGVGSRRSTGLERSAGVQRSVGFQRSTGFRPEERTTGQQQRASTGYRPPYSSSFYPQHYNEIASEGREDTSSGQHSSGSDHTAERTPTTKKKAARKTASTARRSTAKKTAAKPARKWDPFSKK